jgi:hypothetical protein
LFKIKVPVGTINDMVTRCGDKRRQKVLYFSLAMVVSPSKHSINIVDSSKKEHQCPLNMVFAFLLFQPSKNRIPSLHKCKCPFPSPPNIRLVLSDLVNKNTGCPIKFEFQTTIFFLI